MDGMGPLVNISGKRFPFTTDWFYIVRWEDGKFTFVSKDRLTAEEMLYVQESSREALDGYC
jgi:hypothetical protein